MLSLVATEPEVQPAVVPVRVFDDPPRPQASARPERPLRFGATIELGCGTAAGCVFGLRHTTAATIDTAAGDDSGDGYGVGIWFNRARDTLWLCQDASAGATIWQGASSAESMCHVGVPLFNESSFWTAAGRSGRSDIPRSARHLRDPVSAVHPCAGHPINRIGDLAPWNLRPSAA